VEHAARTALLKQLADEPVPVPVIIPEKQG
jgi:hypothetical protein